MRNLFLLLIIVLCIASCDNSKPIEFSIADSGLEYFIVEENAQEQMPQRGEVVVIDIIYTDEKDSLLFSSKEVTGNFKMVVHHSSHEGGSIEQAFEMMHKGDSAIFNIDAASFYEKTRRMRLPNGVRKGSKLKFYIRLIDIIKMAEVQQQEEREKLDSEEAELSMLKRYITRTNIGVKPTESGLYYIEEEKGIGVHPSKGDLVKVHYTGTFISGKPFDSSIDRNEPFEFKIGHGRVIAGWDEGIIKMTVGGKAKLVIPSKLAYGKEGYMPLIPSFSTLVFYVELLEVKETINQ